MPGFATHYLFGVDAYRALPADSIKNNLRDNCQAFALGLQGPDVFFYCPYSHLAHKVNTGNLAHKESTGAFFSHLLAGRKLFAEDEKKLAIADAYITGFIGHYTLDSIVHPYVYAFTKYNAKDPISNSNYFGQHTYFETELDNELIFAKKQLLPSEYPLAGSIALSFAQRSVIARLLAFAYESTYPDANVSQFEVKLATHCMKIGTALLRDPSGKKKVLVRFIEKLLFGHPVISPMIPSDYYQFVTNPFNTDHKKWTHPWTGQVSDESFINLYNKAQSLYNTRISLYYTGTPEEMINEYGNRSFLSGIEL